MILFLISLPGTATHIIIVPEGYDREGTTGELSTPARIEVNEGDVPPQLCLREISLDQAANTIRPVFFFETV